MKTPEAAAGASMDPALISSNNPIYTVSQGETQPKPDEGAAAVRQRREAKSRAKRASSRVVTMVGSCF